MKGATLFLQELEQSGVKLTLTPERNLLINAPKNALNQDHRVHLRTLKNDLIKLIEHKQDSVSRFELNGRNETNETMRPMRQYIFQTAWTGTCFVCDKPVANYYENCPHCGDFPARF